ncbi:hypothetical protein Tco_0833786, partial [Tanacetum coccineum]
APQGEGARAIGAVPGIKSIWNSTWRTGGRLITIKGGLHHTDEACRILAEV